jgi:hypothetical protein
MKMMTHRLLLVAAIGLLLVVVVAQFVSPSGILFQIAWAASEPAKSTEAKKPVYLPPMRGAPTRRVGGATRGAGDEDIFVTVLAPEGTGLTSHESPTLYWFVSRAPTRQVEFTLIRDDRIEPVAEVTLGKPAAGGVIEISLAELGVKLEPGVTYEWSIALVKDPLNRSSDIVTSGTLLWKAPDGALHSRWKAADEEDKFALYGEAGYWYDAIELASEAISSASAAREWRARRASFLEQVGLDKVAAFDQST